TLPQLIAPKVTFSPDGHTLLLNARKEIRFWDMDAQKLLGPTLTTGNDYSYWHCALYSPDGRSLLTSAGDHVVRLRKADTGQPQGPVLGHNAVVNAAAFSPNGQVIATGCADGGIRLWEASDGQMIGQPVWHRAGIAGLAFHPDGEILLSG